MRITTCLAVVFLSLTSVLPLQAAIQVFDFGGLQHGEIVNSQIPGISVTARNVGGGPDLAVAFDSNRRNTRDPDLQSPWDVGNLAPRTNLGNMLIIQENSRGASDGVVDYPDDEGSRPAGSIRINFKTAFTSLGFDLIDIEGTRPSDEPGSVEIYLGNTLLQSVQFMDFLLDPTVQFGNNSANRIAPMSGFGEADMVVFNMGGSGAIDNLQAEVIPEPGTLVIWSVLAFSGVAFGWRQRRQRGRANPSVLAS